MPTSDPAAPRGLLCDAMLGGLARWLRAMGHAAAFDAFIADADLVRRAERTGELVLSSDAPLFERRAFVHGKIGGLFVPRHAPVEEQLAFVMRRLGLPVLPPRCMACGDALVETEPAAVRARVPAGVAQRFELFFACRGCARVFWRGSHWRRIEAVRAAMRGADGREPP